MSALVLEDGGFSSMSVLLPVWPDLVLGPDVNHVWSDILRSQALEKIHVSPQIERFYF